MFRHLDKIASTHSPTIRSAREGSAGNNGKVAARSGTFKLCALSKNTGKLSERSLLTFTTHAQQATQPLGRAQAAHREGVTAFDGHQRAERNTERLRRRQALTSEGSA